MALTTIELARIKAELGFPLSQTGNPYLPNMFVFDQVVQQYLVGGAATTSATAVVAASTPTVVALTLADATDFAAGDRVVIDVDDLEESATVRSKSGSTISVALRLAHAAGYPVVQEGAEWIIREKLREIRGVKAQMSEAFGAGAIRKVDEVEFYNTGGSTLFGNLGRELRVWREELAAAIGVEPAWNAGATRLSCY